jgi:two-component system, chemotaxis family, sensor kinase Cph1
MHEPQSVPLSETPLINPDAESIQFSTSIQPHGMVLVLHESTLTIERISANSLDWLGIEPRSVLGQSLQTLLDDSSVEAILEAIRGILTANALPIQLTFRTPQGDRSFEGTAHATAAGILLALEPALSSPNSFLSLQGQVKQAIAQLRQVEHLNQFLQLAATEVRRLIGFDRVMIYQFDAQGSGAVVAEAKRADLAPYLGLHYPATDIPEPVRALYSQEMLRYIPDLTAEAVEVISHQPASQSASQPLDVRPLDLSLIVLRAVDPCCVQYHRNMGVAALLVVALIHRQQLWGLIACHHLSAKQVSYPVREFCELLGQVVASELANKVNAEELDYLMRLRSLQSEVVESISQIDDLKTALIHPAPRFLDLVSAQGAAVCLEAETTLLGTTPSIEQVQALIQWADPQIEQSIFQTDCLPKLYPPAEEFKEVACGLLLLRISQIRHYYILWFRPEVIQTVNWAGDPKSGIQVEPEGHIRLSPRQSFAQWQEVVRLTSLPWKSGELENALDLRSAIVGIVLNKADELSRINRELELINQELDSFAYAASHDLKEPLRGIHNYSTLLLKSYGETLDETGVARLQTLIRLTRRMEALIDALLKFSRLGQADLQLQLTDLNALVDQVLEDLQVSYSHLHPQIEVPRSLPMIHCDAVLVAEVFTNLLSNALKYNDKTAQIEIGYLDATPKSPVFYVRDNGIGIRERHLSVIFRLFKRLHEQALYGGGTGAGLTIAKKIIDRHGGQLWVESTYGEGSTFYFTLNTTSL